VKGESAFAFIYDERAYDEKASADRHGIALQCIADFISQISEKKYSLRTPCPPKPWHRRMRLLVHRSFNEGGCGEKNIEFRR